MKTENINMMEIGSFLELQLPKGRELYHQEKDVARLNTGRMAIWHAFRITGCKRIWIPIYQAFRGRILFLLQQDRQWVKQHLSLILQKMWQ